MELSGSPSQSPVLPKRKRAASVPNATRQPSVPASKRLGRYVVTGQLGRGGMGIVYEAEDTLLQRKVAIKLLPKEVSANAESLARFLREAQGAARLNHANVVAVYDIGEADGTHYIVMELIKGGNAQDILRSRGPFHWVEATNILMDVCRGVAAAHKAGLIHRDIKPANILHSTDGIVKLGDFGLVKPAGIKGTGVTALGEIVGTPHYMSPEQSRCDSLDERSDIYSLGATYFALLTGRPPFNAADSMQVLFAHCANPVPDPREFVRDVPEACTAIIHKAMAKNRSQRHASARELLADLEKVLDRKAGKSSTAASAPQLPPFVWGRSSSADNTNSLSLAEAYPGERTEVAIEAKGRRWKGIGIGFLSLLVVTILVVAFFIGRKKPLPSTPSEPFPLPADNGPTVDRAPRDGRAETPLVAKDDWPTQAAEANKAIRSRNRLALARVIQDIEVLRNRMQGKEPNQQEAIRQTLNRLEKALAFRESITEKGLVLALHGQVTSVLISPNDRWLAISQSHGDAGAYVFDSYTGEKRYTLWPRRGNVLVRVQAMAFDNESAVLAATCADNCIKVSHFANGKESSIGLGPDVNRALAVSFSPSSRNLVAALEPIGDAEGKGRPYLKIWNIDTRREPFAFKAEHSAKVWSVAYCTGGLQVATGSRDKRVVMWNAETGRIWRELRTGIHIRAIACSSHGRTLAVAGLDQATSVLQIWDYAAETLLAAKPSPHGACHCLAFSGDGKLLATGSGSRIMLWDAETFALVATLTGHSQDVTSLAFLGDGSIVVSGSADQTARLWDVTRYLPVRSEP